MKVLAIVAISFLLLVSKGVNAQPGAWHTYVGATAHKLLRAAEVSGKSECKYGPLTVRGLTIPGGREKYRDRIDLPQIGRGYCSFSDFELQFNTLGDIVSQIFLDTKIDIQYSPPKHSPMAIALAAQVMKYHHRIVHKKDSHKHLFSSAKEERFFGRSRLPRSGPSGCPRKFDCYIVFGKFEGIPIHAYVMRPELGFFSRLIGSENNSEPLIVASVSYFTLQLVGQYENELRRAKRRTYFEIYPMEKKRIEKMLRR